MQIKDERFSELIYSLVNFYRTLKNRYISIFYSIKFRFLKSLPEKVYKHKKSKVIASKRATQNQNVGFYYRLLFLSVILLSFIQFVGAQKNGDYRSKTSGNWSDAAIWEIYNGTSWVNTSNSPVNVPGGITVTISAGTTVNSGSLTVQPLGILRVHGNLFVDGNLNMNFSGNNFSFMYTVTGSIVVINGNAILTNKTIIGIDSYFIVRGNFDGAGGQTDVTVEENAEVYIFGTENNNDIITCDTYPANPATCNSGNSTAFSNNLASFPPVILEQILVGVDCSTAPPVWVTLPQSNGNVNTGGTITLTANATSAGYTPVNYRWTGPNNYYHVTTSNTINISNATIAMTGTYTCTAINRIGCSITASTEVTVGGSCNNAILTLNTGNAYQTVCENDPITNIEYIVGGDATGALVTGLPGGVTGSYNSGVFVIYGTPTETAVFSFTITTTGTPAGCSEATVTGSIAVNKRPATGEIIPD